MVVRIRLARFGKRHQPVYNIVVAQARSARNSKPMEVLGTYDPTPRTPLAFTDVSPTADPTSSLPSSSSMHSARKQKKYKDVQLDMSRTKYWLGVGAQPSEPVWRLLSLIGLLEPRPYTQRKTTTSTTTPTGSKASSQSDGDKGEQVDAIAATS